MALQGRLNRKARLAISAATLVVLAGPFLGITTCISTALRHQAAVAPFHPLEDGLLRLDNGATLFLTDGALSRKISAWLNSDTDAKWIFEIADSTQGLAEPGCRGDWPERRPLERRIALPAHERTPTRLLRSRFQ